MSPVLSATLQFIVILYVKCRLFRKVAHVFNYAPHHGTQLHAFLTSTLGEWEASSAGRFIPTKIAPSSGIVLDR